MAEALAKRRFGDDAFIRSAGLWPQSPEDAANAIKTLKNQFDLDASEHIPRDVRDFNFDDFDLIVAMDKSVTRELKIVPSTKLIIWNIEDPYGNDLTKYRRHALDIMREVERMTFSEN